MPGVREYKTREGNKRACSRAGYQLLVPALTAGNHGLISRFIGTTNANPRHHVAGPGRSPTPPCCAGGISHPKHRTRTKPCGPVAEHADLIVIDGQGWLLCPASVPQLDQLAALDATREDLEDDDPAEHAEDGFRNPTGDKPCRSRKSGAS